MSRRPPFAAVALLALLLGSGCRLERAPSGRPAGAGGGGEGPGGGGAPTVEDSAASAAVLAALHLYYRRLTTRDVRVLRRSFWPHATVTMILKAGHDTAERVHTVPIEDLTGRAAHDCPVRNTDEIATASVATYGPLAEAWVVYRWRCGLSRDSAVTRYGVDAFHLMAHGGVWRIAGLAVTREIPGRPLGH